MAENYLAAERALGLSREELVQLAAASFEAWFLDDETRARYLEELRAHAS